MGFQVVEAIDGQEGLEKLEDLYEMYGDTIEENLKLILSDVEMPRMDGFHFAANVKEDSRFEGIPITPLSVIIFLRLELKKREPRLI